MEYTVKTNASPDGIIITASKFWVDTYPEMYALIRSLDNLNLDPEHMVIMQDVLKKVSEIIPKWEGLCRDLQITESIGIVKEINEVFELVTEKRDRY